jgi:hypothetical protein
VVLSFFKLVSPVPRRERWVVSLSHCREARTKNTNRVSGQRICKTARSCSTTIRVASLTIGSVYILIDNRQRLHRRSISSTFALIQGLRNPMWVNAFSVRCWLVLPLHLVLVCITVLNVYKICFELKFGIRITHIFPASYHPHHSTIPKDYLVTDQIKGN